MLRCHWILFHLCLYILPLIGLVWRIQAGAKTIPIFFHRAHYAKEKYLFEFLQGHKFVHFSKSKKVCFGEEKRRDHILEKRSVSDKKFI